MRKKKLVFNSMMVIGASVLIYTHPLKISPKNLISPENSYLSSEIGHNIWIPKSTNEQFQDAPIISAESAFFINANTGQVLYQKNPNVELPIASLTKIMTVIVALDYKKYSDYLSVSKYAASMPPDHMELRAGEKLKLDDLLYGIFLISGNDAAEVLAEDSTGNRSQFIKLMNQKAKEIGMENTLFVNPTGLQDGKIQYSTAYDVALMARYAIKKYPHLIDISSTPYKFIPSTKNHQDYTLNSGINLLTTYPGVKGFKLGYTPDAGLTMVTFAQKDGISIIGVLLNSQDRRDEARALLNYCFGKYNISPVPSE